MKESTLKDVFEANKFSNLLADVAGYKFITIKKNKFGKYFAFTSNLDVLKMLLFMILLIWLFFDLLGTSLDKQAKRSLIFEIIVLLNGKIQGNHPTVVMIFAFLFRYKYFKIIRNIHWIDSKVRNCTLKDLYLIFIIFSFNCWESIEISILIVAT